MRALVFGAILCMGSGVAAWGAACTTPVAGAPTLDLTTAGASGFINSAYFIQIPDQSTGTGVIDPFVRLSTNDNCEQGYNTDGRPLPFDENSSPTFTHDLLLSAVPQVNLGGILYFQFLLDINQTGTNPLLSLDSLQIYQSNTGGIKSTTLSDLGTKIYDLDTGGNHWIKLDYSLNSGSGSGDMFAYIPVSVFDLTKTNIYLFSRFGEEFNQNDGFEEWATIKGATTTVSPEPLSMSLVGTGLLALGFFGSRRRARK